MKRLPKALPKPMTHIIDWFHLAMKIRPMQQIADHIVGSRPILCGILAVIDEEIKSLKWKLWHGQVERAPPDLSTNPAFAQSRLNPRVFAALVGRLQKP